MSDQIMTENSPKICKICEQNVSKYCCPRCNVLYCSMDCYKAESHMQCSESFYRDCINEEMGIMDCDISAKKRMMEILSKMRSEEEMDLENPEKFLELLNDDENQDSQDGSEEDEAKDSDDGDSIPDLAARLKDVDLDDADKVWHLLTEDEKKDFESILNSGDVTKILPSWQPWWLYRRPKLLIEEVGATQPVEDYRALCPKLIQHVQDFSCLSKQKPAACVKYNLLNVLAAYVFTARIFNGDHLASEAEAVSCLVAICSNLKTGANFEDSATAVESVIQECQNNPSLIGSMDPEIKNIIRHDVRCLVTGPEDSNKTFYLNCALADLHALLAAVSRTSRASQKDKSQNEMKGEFQKRFADHKLQNLSTVPKDKIKLCVKKLQYYLSYIKSHSNEICLDTELSS